MKKRDPFDITNPNSKTETCTCIQTCFHHVNTNNASLGMRENVKLTNLIPKFSGENMAPKYRIGESWGEGTPGRDILQGEEFVPIVRWGKREKCRHPWMDILTPRKNFVPPLCYGVAQLRLVERLE